MPLIQLPDGQWVEYDPSTGTVEIPNPFGPGSQGSVPATTDTTGLTPEEIAQQVANQASNRAGGTPAFLPAAMKWLASIALVWIVLTALTEYSPNMRQIGVGLAGLILVGALYYLGPTAIKNAQHLW